MNKYIKKNKNNLILAILMSTITSILAVSLQFIKGDVLDYALKGDLKNGAYYGLLLGVFILLEIVSYYIYNLFRGKYTVDSMGDLREDYFKSILNKEYPDFIQKVQGDYISNYTNKIEIIVRGYIGNIPLLAEITIKIILVSISLFILDTRIAIVTLFLLTLPLYVPKLAEKKLHKSRSEDVETYEKHLSLLVDWLSGLEVIKNFGIENIVKNKFEENNSQVKNKGLNMRKVGYFSQLLTAILSYFSHFTILVFASYLVFKGEFSAGDFFISISMIDQLSYPILSLTGFLQEIVSAKPVCKDLEKLINVESKIDKNKLIEKPLNIQFKDVSFGYNKEIVLKDINFNILEKEKCLIIGESGSGKSTILNLILGYYKPDKGEVLINNTETYYGKQLSKQISIMRQDVILFNDTLRNNLTMYSDIKDKKLIDILNKVGLSRYANIKGLDMIISEKGSNFSGGEKRRISLARTFLKDSKIILLDEPLANLDIETSRLIEQLIESIKDKTVIMVSHEYSKKFMDIFDKVIEAWKFIGNTINLKRF